MAAAGPGGRGSAIPRELHFHVRSESPRRSTSTAFRPIIIRQTDGHRRPDRASSDPSPAGGDEIPSCLSAFRPRDTRRLPAEGARRSGLWNGLSGPRAGPLDQGSRRTAITSEILRWLGSFKAPPTRKFLVHGEPRAIVGMKGHIAEQHPEWQVTVPKYREVFEL